MVGGNFRFLLQADLFAIELWSYNQADDDDVDDDEEEGADVDKVKVFFDAIFSRCDENNSNNNNHSKKKK